MRHARSLGALLVTVAAAGCSDTSTPTSPADPAALLPDKPQLITAGVPTGTSYGGVGMLIIDEGNNLTVDGICTGSLISPTVFLTAGHCISPPGTAYYITFIPDAIPLPPISQLIRSTTAFRSTADDIGVVILPAGSTTGIPVYDVPSLGFLDEVNERGGLARDRAVLVGYGTAWLGRGAETSGLDGVRKVATAKILSLGNPTLGSGSLGTHLLIIADAHGRSGQGGTCGGDSGGPVFLEDQDPDLIVAITSAGWPDGCHARGIYFRLDTPTCGAFYRPFGILAHQARNSASPPRRRAPVAGRPVSGSSVPEIAEAP